MARSRLLKPSFYIRRAALNKGVFGGHRGWLAVGAVVWGRGFVKKALGKNEQIVATEILKKGQFVSVEALVPPTRKQRKTAARNSR